MPGDVVAGMDAEFTARVWLGTPGLLNQRVCRLRSERSSAFTREAVAQPLAYIEGHKSGTTVIHLNKRDLEETMVSLPSVEASIEFDSRVAELVNVEVSAAKESATLAATRDALLPALMSGRLSVADL